VPCVNNSHSALSTEATFSGETGVDVDGTYLCVAACCDSIAACVVIVKLYGKSF